MVPARAGAQAGGSPTAQRGSIAVPLPAVATGAPGAEEPESYVFSPSGIMLSRVRHALAPAAPPGGGGGGADGRGDAQAEIQAAPGERAGPPERRRRRRRRRDAAEREAPATAPSASDGSAAADTDSERQPQARRGAGERRNPQQHA